MSRLVGKDPRRAWASPFSLRKAFQEQALLSQLLTTDPKPFDLDAPELWVQRKAITQLIRYGGVTALLPYYPAIRP
jgi:hypothetical protein